jgi:16S rRNA (uracil1498-N3)-methyltransferase
MRRIHLPAIFPGRIELPDSQAHYLRDVLRLASGDAIEAFDAAGQVGRGKLAIGPNSAVAIEIESVAAAPLRDFFLSIAAAVPKANRADWMIEKLSELGANEFIPLITDRGVVQPRQGGEGGKFDRWRRIAGEASRQSGRADLMEIQPPIDLKQLLAADAPKGIIHWQLSTRADAEPMLAEKDSLPTTLRLLIGPEGGWSPEEESLFQQNKIFAVSLTPTTLRVETAAVAAAAVALVFQAALTPATQAATIPPASKIPASEKP